MGEISDELEAMPLDAILTRWPTTLRVFIDWRLHCVGCPIAGFHRIADSAFEHGYEREELTRAISLAIETGGASRAARPRRRRRSAAGGAGP